MPTLRFYDLLGVAEGDDAAAAARWPTSRVQGETGVVTGDATTLELVRYLQSALRFRAVRPGAAPDRVGLSAEVIVSNPPQPLIRPLVLRQMPDIAFFLQDTVGDPGTSGYRPARLYVTTADTGAELVIEGLPVEIRIPSELLGPLREPAEEEAHPEGGPDVDLTEPFASGVYDSLAVTLRDAAPFSSIWVHIRVRMTEELDFIIEPAVPISIGPCRFNGLPCHGLHDIGFVPSPRLQDERPGEQALEWTRHTINPFARELGFVEWAGVLTARTVDLNAFRPPLLDITERLNEGRENNLKVEFVLHDVAFPFFNLTGLPLPVHALFGLRRPIVAGDDPAEAFNLTDPPIIRLGDYRVIIDQLLLRTPASLNPLDQFIFANAALLREGDTAPREGTSTIGVTDDWTLQLGWRYPEGRSLFTVADANVRFWGFKLGVSIGRWTSKTRHEWYDMLQALVDLEIATKGSSVFGGAFKLRSLTGKDVHVIARDLGWNLGSFSLGGLAFPDGVQLVAFDTISLIAEEIGWVSETNGGTYFSLSGGVVFSLWQRTRPPAAGTGSAALGDARDKAGGVMFRRLRFRTGGNPSAPAVLLDGVSLSLRLGRFSLTGLGMIHEFTAAGHEYKEFAFGIEIEFDALGRHFLIGMQLFYGRVRGPAHNFTYWLFGVRLGFLPVGSFELQNVRMLAASNLTPNLPPPDGQQQEMRIFRWYRASGDGAITLPSDRRVGSWRPVDESVAFAAGARASTAGATTLTFDLFCLGFGGPEGKGFFAALEVYFARSAKPIGFAAIEWDLDRDKIGILIGVALSIDNVLPDGVSIGFLQDLASITGTLFIGNKPGTVALGQLNDQATWFGFRFATSRLLDASVTVAICLQYVSTPEGPRGFGLLFEAKGGGSYGIGKVQGYFTLMLVAGVWRNESVAGGFVAWIEAGLRIKVFRVFNFGASIRIEWDQLGPAPTYKRLAFVLRINTPWWLPNVTFRFERMFGQPRPELMRVVSTPLISAAALDHGRQTEVPVLVAPIIGGAIDEPGVYHVSQLAGLGDPPLSESAIEALTPVGVDSTIALGFKPAVDDQLTVGENTPAGAGTQSATPPAVSDLAVTYELIEIGIQRRPRFGPGAATWTTLLAPEDTKLQTPADLPPQTELSALFDSDVSFRWDRDRVYQDRLDPRRLLVNAETPYTFVTEDAEADEVMVGSEPGWPCCVPDRRRPQRWHELDFSGTPLGIRAPPSQRFSDSASTLHWIGAKPPVVAPGLVAPPTSHAARIILAGRPASTLATVSFDRPAAVVEIDIYWRGGAALGALAIEAYDGLDRVLAQTLPFSAASPPAPIRIQRLEGMTSLRLRIVGGTGDVPPRGGVTPGTGLGLPIRDIAPVGLGGFDVAPRLRFPEPATPLQPGLGGFDMPSRPPPLTADPGPAGRAPNGRTSPVSSEVRPSFTNAGLAGLASSTAAATVPGLLGWIELVRMRYRTVREELDAIAWDEKCRRRGQQALNGGGRLAWLPNHDYEISLTTKITVTHERSGAQTSLVRQKAGFRTKGLPGLNAVERIGDELEPYVESRYPGPAPRTLYRSEPVALAFNERFNILVPVDRAPSPENPDELNQILEWVLAVERVGTPLGSERVSQTSPDWVVAHRPLPLPPGRRRPRIIDGVLVKETVRQAKTFDPFRTRFEALVHGPFGCGDGGPSLHRSQVLLHQPVDLDAAPAEAQLWEPGNTYRVNVRRKLGPFVERDPFDPDDAPAFARATDGAGPVRPWTSTDGTMRVVQAPADGARRYAVFGESNWNHVQVRVAVDPQGGAAGVALALAGVPTVSRAAHALVDEAAGALRLVERLGGIDTDLATQTLPDDAGAPYALEVIAFDDRLRATVGDVTVEATRSHLREGRLALVAQNGGAFHSLRVEPLDAYRFDFQSSRFATFEQHIASFDGTVQAIPSDPAHSVADLLAATGHEIAAAMAPDADPISRQALFDRWVSSLGLLLRREPGRLSLSRVLAGDATELLILESPEPLPFSTDVTLELSHQGPAPPTPAPGCLSAILDALFRRGRAPGLPLSSATKIVDPIRILTNASETVALVLPAVNAPSTFAPLPTRTYRFDFEVNRTRFRAQVPDDDSNYRAAASFTVDL